MTEEHRHHVGEGAHDVKNDPPLTPEQAAGPVPANRHAYEEEERTNEEGLEPARKNPLAGRTGKP